MKTVYSLLFVCILFCCSSCHKLGLCKDEPLTMQKAEFITNEFKIDGFYYGYPSTDYQGITSYRTLLFYRNGIALLPGVAELENLEDYIEAVGNGEMIKNVKYIWGAFFVNDGKVLIEKFAGGPCGSPVELLTYDILNDSTLVLTHIRTKDGREIDDEEVNEIYHFRPLSVKPDSVNNIIK